MEGLRILIQFFWRKKGIEKERKKEIGRNKSLLKHFSGLEIGLYTNLYTFIREISALYIFKFLEMFKTICLLRTGEYLSVNHIPRLSRFHFSVWQNKSGAIHLKRPELHQSHM